MALGPYVWTRLFIPEGHVHSIFVPWSQLTVQSDPHKGPGQHGKLIGPLSIRYLTHSTMDQIIYKRGLCSFWLVLQSQSWVQGDLHTGPGMGLEHITATSYSFLGQINFDLVNMAKLIILYTGPGYLINST